MELNPGAQSRLTPTRKLARSLFSGSQALWQRMVFRSLWRIAPTRATDRAMQVFLTPPHGSFSDAEFAALDEARMLPVPSPTGRMTAWQWGRRKDPIVVMVHGWGGRSTQLRAFIKPVVQRGFSVVAFDAPGHGMSGRGESSLPHFLHGLTTVLDFLGAVHAVVGYSAGGVAAAMALAKRPSVACGVLIAPPASLADFSRQVATVMGWPEALRAAMQRRVESRFGYRWTEFEAESSSGRQPLLVIHDTDDREVPLSEGRRHVCSWPRAQLLATNGMGHRRILNSPATILATADFIAAHRQ